MRSGIVILGASLVLFVTAQAADAQPSLHFEFAVSGTPTSSITIPSIGASEAVQVFLVQNSGTTILTDEGLIAAGVVVTYGAPSGVAAVQTVADIQENPGFDDLFLLAKTTDASTTAGLAESVDFFSPFVFPAVGSDRILIGTFTFTSLAAGTTAIATADFSGLDDTVTGLGTVLDSFIAQANGDITAVPEPGSAALALTMLTGSAIFSCWRSRRKRRIAGENGPA